MENKTKLWIMIILGYGVFVMGLITFGMMYG